MEAQINIESTKPESIDAIISAIIAILNSSVEEKTKRVALKVFSERAAGLAPSNINISDNTFLSPKDNAL